MLIKNLDIIMGSVTPLSVSYAHLAIHNLNRPFVFSKYRVQKKVPRLRKGFQVALMNRKRQ